MRGGQPPGALPPLLCRHAGDPSHGGTSTHALPPLRHPHSRRMHPLGCIGARGACLCGKASNFAPPHHHPIPSPPTPSLFTFLSHIARLEQLGPPPGLWRLGLRTQADGPAPGRVKTVWTVKCGRRLRLGDGSAFARESHQTNKKWRGVEFFALTKKGTMWNTHAPGPGLSLPDVLDWESPRA